MASRPLALLLDHKEDSVEKDSASPEKKLKVDDNKDLGDNSHHLPDPMSCDDPKVAKNDSVDNSLKPNEDLFSEAEARQHFQSWCEDNEVEHVDEEEERRRFSIFKERLEWIKHQQYKGKPVAQNDLGDNSLKPNQDLFSVEEARQHFQSWCEDFEVKYVNKEEECYRFSVFKERLEWITQQQNKGKPVAINNLADQTEDEIVSLLFCKDCDSESDTEQDHTQEPHAEKEKGYLSEDASDDDAFG